MGQGVDHLGGQPIAVIAQLRDRTPRIDMAHQLAAVVMLEAGDGAQRIGLA